MDPMRSSRQSISGSSSPGNPGSVSGDTSLMRNRNKRRDDAIRKKAEQELAKKNTRRGDKTLPSKKKANTVSSLKPAQAITVLETARIVQAAQLMAAKRADAVLAINEDGQLSGILTDKDIAYRVVAEGLDIRQTTVASVMTRNPISVYDKGNRNEALNIMVERKFRHLPVITDVSEDYDDEFDEGISERSVTSNVVGLLDITKCVFERLDDLERKVNEDQSIVSAMEVLERRGTVDSDHVGQMRVQHSCPDLGNVIQKVALENNTEEPASVGIRAYVKEAAKVMKDFHTTAVLVLNNAEDDKLGGIFTTKDIVLRVVAAGLDPNTTSVVRVMTPHPDSVTVDTSILDALKKLHIGHYLHLPVVDNNYPVGLVDVLELTIAMLNYLVSKESVPESSGNEGPMWNRFWNSTFKAGSVADDDFDRQSLHSDGQTPSIVSPSLMSAGHYLQGGYSLPPPRSHIPPAEGPRFQNYANVINDEASQYGVQSTVTAANQLDIEDRQFTFKLRDGKSGKVYRFVSSKTSFRELVEQIYQKCGIRVNPSSVNSFLRISYLDDENDVIHISSDKDLEEACAMAKRVKWTNLKIFLGDPLQEEFSSPQVTSPQLQQIKTSPAIIEREISEKSVIEKLPSKQSPGVVDFLKEAPMAVNVAISASIVVLAVVIITRLTN
ncbi:hypothetical protein HK096_004740 [Nowakowskiella sp. JEL0078]|nr:hypothetical protein HK096_004740 [Nowakowskiella sp. JEL0078]